MDHGGDTAAVGDLETATAGPVADRGGLLAVGGPTAPSTLRFAEPRRYCGRAPGGCGAGASACSTSGEQARNSHHVVAVSEAPRGDALRDRGTAQVHRQHPDGQTAAVLLGGTDLVPQQPCRRHGVRRRLRHRVLSSRVHGAWAWSRSSSPETRLRYTPSTAFETFPRPDPTRPASRGRRWSRPLGRCLRVKGRLALPCLSLTQPCGLAWSAPAAATGTWSPGALAKDSTPGR